MSDLWTLRRWMMWARLGMVVVALVGAVATFASSRDPQPTALPKARLKALCPKLAAGSEREARRLEEHTGRPARGFSTETCLDSLDGRAGPP